MTPYLIPWGAEPTDFPPVHHALPDPDGLLAIGGDLSTERLIAAYRRGIFPWYTEDEPILWWSPMARMVLFLDELKVGRSLRKNIRKREYALTLDTAFHDVIKACSEDRGDHAGTWVTEEMQEAYCELHRRGLAHSVESWYQGELVGGLYGVSLGRIFFGESMFARRSDASKIAFCHLVWQLQRWQYDLIDAQVYTDHLARFGARIITRDQYCDLLGKLCNASSAHQGEWQFDHDLLQTG